MIGMSIAKCYMIVDVQLKVSIPTSCHKAILPVKFLHYHYTPFLILYRRFPKIVKKLVRM